MATNRYDASETPGDIVAATTHPKRPVTITVLAWFLIVGGILFLATKPLTWSEFTPERNLWNVFTKSLSLVCGVGLLKMRKWAVVLYFGLFVLNTVLLYVWPPNAEVLRVYSQSLPIAMLFVMPTIVALITLPFWNRMAWGPSSERNDA